MYGNPAVYQNICLTIACFLLKTFANSLDPDQDRRSVGPDLGPNCFDTLIVYMYVPERKFCKKENFENNSANVYNKSIKNYQACKELMYKNISFAFLSIC